MGLVCRELEISTVKIRERDEIRKRAQHDAWAKGEADRREVGGDAW